MPLGTAGIEHAARSRAAQQVQRAVEDVAERIRKSRLTSEVSSRLARARVEGGDYWVERSTQADKFDSLVADTEKAHKDIRTRAMGGLTDPEAQQMLSLRLDDYFATERQNAAATARTQEIHHIKAQTGQMLEDTRTAASQAKDPNERADLLATAQATLQGHVASGIYTQTDGQAIWSEFMEGVTDEQFQKMIRTNPGGAIRVLQGDKPIEHLTEARRNTLLRQAQSADSVNRQALSAQARSMAESDLQSIIDTGQPVPGTLRELSAAMGPEAAQQHAAARARAFKYHEKVTALKTATPAEAAEILNAETPQGGSADYAEQQQFHTQLTNNYLKQLKMRESDAAMAVADHPTVKDAQERVAAGTLSVRDAAAVSLAAQADVGVPPDKRRVLTNNQAASLAAEYQTTPDAQKGDYIAQLQEAYGEHFPAAYKELVNQGVPAEAQLMGNLAYMPWGAQTTPAFAEAVRTGDKALKEAIGTDQANDVRDEVAAQMVDYNESFQAGTYMPGRTEWLNSMRQSVELLAMQYSQKYSPEEAAKKATDELINKAYRFHDGYRVPVQYDVDIVSKAARALRYRVDAFEPVPHGDPTGTLTPDQLKSAYLRDLRNNGQWATLPDESGLVLLDSLGLPVQNAARQQYELRFDEADAVPGNTAGELAGQREYRLP